MEGDKLIITNAKFLAHIGVTQEEKADPQELLISTEVFLDMRPSAASDEIKDTIDYIAVHELIQKTLDKTRYNLLEKLGEALAQNMLAQFPAHKVKVKITKPQVAQEYNLQEMGIEVVREHGKSLSWSGK
jgi:7,8-dihydroneopterin aldolase/epimerase/oxygenase